MHGVINSWDKIQNIYQRIIMRQNLILLGELSHLLADDAVDINS